MKWSNLIILTLSVAVTQSKILEELEIKISKDIPALNCENILNNLEVSIFNILIHYLKCLGLQYRSLAHLL